MRFPVLTPRKRVAVALGAAFLTGAVLSAGAMRLWFAPVPTTGLSGLRESDLNPESPYTYVDPLLAVRGIDPVSSIPYNGLQNSVQSYVDAQTKAGNLQATTVYLRDLKTSGGFTINPNEQYSPASLLKVPTMMVYYQLAEDDPGILNEQLTYSGAVDANTQENLPSPVQIAPGTYTADKLIQHMIKYSDNNAAELLVENLNGSGNAAAFDTLFKDLGIGQIDLTSDYMTVRAYSLFFRVLYNATYLDPETSEKALKLLTETDFTKGITQGVPADVDVAQKFGEYTDVENGLVLKRELNTCGIVYYPGHPYLLCVMTKGSDFAQLETFIGHVSDQVYQFEEKMYAADAKK